MIDINISKSELMNKFKFDSNAAKASHYLDVKGVMYYANMVNYLEEKGIIDSDDFKIEYELVHSFYRYDKRLRKVIYKYVAAFEEFVRAYILNEKIDFVEVLNNKNKERLQEIKRNVKRFENMNMAEKLLEFSFRDTITVVENKREEFKEIFRLSGINLQGNLRAILDLRNKVNHFKILLMCRDYKKCCEHLKSKTDLEKNIINLKHLLPACFREKMVKEINEAKKGLDSIEQLKEIFVDIDEN